MDVFINFCKLTMMNCRSRCFYNYLGTTFAYGLYVFLDPRATLPYRLLGQVGNILGSQGVAILLMIVPKLFAKNVRCLYSTNINQICRINLVVETRHLLPIKEESDLLKSQSLLLSQYTLNLIRFLLQGFSAWMQ